MTISKLNVVYFSPTQSTKKIVQKIAQSLALNVPSPQINLTSKASREKTYLFKEDELVLLALPSYGGRIPQVLPQILLCLQGFYTPVIIVGVYGERGYGDVLLECQNALRDAGFVCIAGATFIAQHAIASKLGANRPDSSDDEKIQEFGKLLSTKISTADGSASALELIMPGKVPYAEIPKAPPLSPTTNEKCIRCMLCFRWCPTDAIPTYNPFDTDASACIRCHGCVRRCPVGAREMSNPVFLSKVEAMENAYDGVRREPEFFL